ncbi:MAG: MucR family transcriptional regulator [Sphingomonadales bacterium]
MNDKKIDDRELLSLTTDIVASHVSNNTVAVDELGPLIQQVWEALANTNRQDAEPKPQKPRPAVPIRRSITPDYLICLEDGKKLKMLKRHLKSSYGLNPDEYRERWGLPANYPMVAPNYAERRRTLAKQIGLGKSRRA